MNIILLAAFIGLVVGFFLLFGISPMEFTEGIFTRILAKPNSIKSQINEATKRKTFSAEKFPKRRKFFGLQIARICSEFCALARSVCRR